MEPIAALAAALLLLAIFGDGGGSSKKQDKKLYKHDELFLGREASDDDAYYVYTYDPSFEILFRGSLHECCDFLRENTED